MKFRTVTALFAVGALAISGCSSDDSSSSDDKKETTSTTAAAADAGDRDRDALIEALGSDGTFEAEQTECLADETISSLSDDGYELTLDDADFTEFNDEDLDVISAALDECLDIELVKELLVSQGFGNGLDDEATECVADAAVSSYDGIGAMFIAMGSETGLEDFTSAILAGFTDCLDDDGATEFVRQSFLDQGLEEEMVDCVIGAAAASYTGSEMLQGLLNQDEAFIAELDAAALACDPTAMAPAEG